MVFTCRLKRFQHTAARRRLADLIEEPHNGKPVSTHSRPKAAGASRHRARCRQQVSTHSRPKAAGTAAQAVILTSRFQHTAARRRLESCFFHHLHISQFQHTAARRRLVARSSKNRYRISVSTHSRPKAAGR